MPRDEVEGYKSVESGKLDCIHCVVHNSDCRIVNCEADKRADGKTVIFIKTSPYTAHQVIDKVIQLLDNNWYKSQEDIKLAVLRLKEEINELL